MLGGGGHRRVADCTSGTATREAAHADQGLAIPIRTPHLTCNHGHHKQDQMALVSVGVGVGDSYRQRRLKLVTDWCERCHHVEADAIDEEDA